MGFQALASIIVYSTSGPQETGPKHFLKIFYTNGKIKKYEEKPAIYGQVGKIVFGKVTQNTEIQKW